MYKHITTKPTSLLKRKLFFNDCFKRQGILQADLELVIFLLSPLECVGLQAFTSCPLSDVYVLYSLFPNTECRCPLHWYQLARLLLQQSVGIRGGCGKALQMLWVSLPRPVLMPRAVSWLSPWGHGALIPVSFFLAFRTSQP